MHFLCFLAVLELMSDSLTALFTIVNHIFEEPFLSHSLRLCPASQGFQGTGHPTRRLIIPLSRVKEKFLSRDKKVLPVPLSLCPGTKAGANVPGQTPLSRDVPGQNEFLKILKKRTDFLFQNNLFTVSEHPFLFQNILFCFRTSLCQYVHDQKCLLSSTIQRTVLH